MAFAISFRAQGNADMQVGLAVGRMGSQVLIQYRIKDGSERERWLPRGRYVMSPSEAFYTLPVYHRVKCDGSPADPNRSGQCVKCGSWIGWGNKQHSAVVLKGEK